MKKLALLKRPALTKMALIESLDSADNYKILADSIYPRGVFLSYQEFLNNAPSISNFYTPALVPWLKTEVIIHSSYLSLQSFTAKRKRKA